MGYWLTISGLECCICFSCNKRFNVGSIAMRDTHVRGQVPHEQPPLELVLGCVSLLLQPLQPTLEGAGSCSRKSAEGRFLVYLFIIRGGQLKPRIQHVEANVGLRASGLEQPALPW